MPATFDRVVFKKQQLINLTSFYMQPSRNTNLLQTSHYLYQVESQQQANFQFENYYQLMHFIQQEPYHTTQYTPIKHHSKLQQQQQNTAQTSPSPPKTIQDIDEDQLFQHFHHYVKVIEEIHKQEQPTQVKRRLSYEFAEIPIKKLFCDEDNSIVQEAHQQQINQQAVQDSNQQLQKICKKSTPIKVEMMAVKKNTKIYQTPPKKQKQPRQELMWATLKAIR